jgi:hypothetical protein
VAVDGVDRVQALSMLPRRWWFPDLVGLRTGDAAATYAEFDLDTQPAVDIDPGLSWLTGVRQYRRNSIEDSDASPQRRFNSAGLADLLPRGVRVPPALAAFADDRGLRRRLRSATACYLDLADVAVRTSADGVLVHVLSDQQWVLHWLIYLDRVGSEAMVTTSEPVGFLMAEDSDDEPIPEVVPLDGSFDLQVCADSFAEFLHRFWIENELWFLGGAEPKSPLLASYAAKLRSTARERRTG